MTEEKIIDRIKKVLAKANSTNNEAEAEMLMAKVNELLELHNIEMVDLNRLGEDPMGTERNVGKIWPNTQWLGNLSNALARYYGARVVTTQMTKNKKHIHVSGRESSRVTFQLMLPYVVSQVRKQAKVLMAEEGMSKLRAERQMANAMTARLGRLRREAEQRDQERTASGNSSALVPVDEVEAEMEDAFPNLVTGRKTTIRSSAAARKLAEDISLNNQMGGKGQRRIAV